ncbi:MAG: SCO family protein [Phycisphaerales bacterium]|nr:SCO family protein [Phycisphaerales bacterium]
MTIAASIFLSCLLSQSSIAPFAPGETPVSGDTVAPEMEGVDITERLGDTIPLSTVLMGDDGREITLGQILSAGKPIMLHMGYYKCPMLCTLVLNEGFRALAKVDLSLGKDFELVSISVNPNESSELAHAKKQGYLAEYSRAGSDDGVRFLTALKTADGAGAPATIANAVGFHYKALPSGEYSHPAMLAMIAADGRIVRYLYGVKFDPQTMRMAIVEAGEGKIGTPLDRFILWCHQYDPSSQGYVLIAFRVMQIGGAVTVVVLAAGLIVLFRRGARTARLAPDRSQSMNPRAA